MYLMISRSTMECIKYSDEQDSQSQVVETVFQKFQEYWRGLVSDVSGDESGSSSIGLIYKTYTLKGVEAVVGREEEGGGSCGCGGFAGGRLLVTGLGTPAQPPPITWCHARAPYSAISGSVCISISFGDDSVSFA